MPSPNQQIGPAGSKNELTKKGDYHGFNSKHKHCVANGAAQPNRFTN